MRIFLAVFLVTTSNFLFATDNDSVEIDSNFRLYDVQSERMVDKDVQLKFVEQEKPKRDEAGEFLRGPVGPAPAEGGNYDSIHNINPKVAGFITVCFLSFVGYIIFRVWRSMRRDERNRRRF